MSSPEGFISQEQELNIEAEQKQNPFKEELIELRNRYIKGLEELDGWGGKAENVEHFYAPKIEKCEAKIKFVELYEDVFKFNCSQEEYEAKGGIRDRIAEFSDAIVNGRITWQTLERQGLKRPQGEKLMDIFVEIVRKVTNSIRKEQTSEELEKMLKGYKDQFEKAKFSYLNMLEKIKKSGKQISPEFQNDLDELSGAK